MLALKAGYTLETAMDDKTVYDVIVVENDRIVSVTVWKRVELRRAIRLALREAPKYEAGTNDRVGLMRSNTGYLNCKVKGSVKDFEFVDYVNIQGRQSVKGRTNQSVLMFEKELTA